MHVIRKTALALGLVGGCGAASAQSVWINEIHYTNTGSDMGEFVEVAGEAGTDLTGWTVVGYDGDAGTVYDTRSLVGTLPDEGTCRVAYGTSDIFYGGLHNGGTTGDGIALVMPDDTVVQFISYEGSFMASEGPAAGMVSVDIGVFEDGTDPAGMSLQLSGIGTALGDFTWIGPIASSRGEVNSVQTIAPMAVSLHRNGGANPNVYTSPPMVLGGAFEPTVDLSVTGHTGAALFGFFSATNVTLGSGQTLLCLDTGQGEVFSGGGLLLSGSPLATISVVIPNNTGLCGFQFCSQGVLFGGVAPFALSNAYDHTIGA